MGDINVKVDVNKKLKIGKATLDEPFSYFSQKCYLNTHFQGPGVTSEDGPLEQCYPDPWLVPQRKVNADLWEIKKHRLDDFSDLPPTDELPSSVFLHSRYGEKKSKYFSNELIKGSRFFTQNNIEAALEMTSDIISTDTLLNETHANLLSCEHSNLHDTLSSGSDTVSAMLSMDSNTNVAMLVEIFNNAGSVNESEIVRASFLNQTYSDNQIFAERLQNFQMTDPTIKASRDAMIRKFGKDVVWGVQKRFKVRLDFADEISVRKSVSHLLNCDVLYNEYTGTFEIALSTIVLINYFPSNVQLAAKYRLRALDPINAYDLRNKYTRDLSELNGSVTNLIYLKNRRFGEWDPSEPEWYRYETFEDGTNDKGTRCGLCPYCEDVRFDIISNYEYSNHLATIHGILENNLIVPEGYAFGIYRLRGPKISARKSVLGNSRKLECEGVECPACREVIRLQNRSLRNYFNHYSKHHKNLVQGNPVEIKTQPL